jgi:uncharacterized protein (DUF983 family)
VSDLPGAPVMLLRGLRKRCPRCGGGHLFVTYTRLRTSCPSCRLLFERDRGVFADAWLGAITINTAFTFAVIAIALVGGLVLTWPHPPAFALTAAVMAVTALFSVWFVPNSKTTWLAVELWMRGFEPEDLAEV